MIPRRFSRTDIYIVATAAGLRDDEATDLSYELSEECRTVLAPKVLRAIANRIEEIQNDHH